jgi:hypothetical protein
MEMLEHTNRRCLLLAGLSVFLLAASGVSNAAWAQAHAGGSESGRGGGAGGRAGGGRPDAHAGSSHASGDDHGDDHASDDEHDDAGHASHDDQDGASDHGSKGKGPMYRGGRVSRASGNGRGRSLADRVLKIALPEQE